MLLSLRLMQGPITYHNPVNGEYTTIIESSAETGGKYSLLEVVLKPGGGNPLHYHTRFTEEFFALEGPLGLQYRNSDMHLQPGESKLVPLNITHRFFNNSSHDIRFRIKLSPGQPGFENFIKVHFGLLNDGRTFGNQFPKNPLHAALLLGWSDTHIAEPLFKILTPFAFIGCKAARLLKIDRALLRRYT